MKQNFGDTILSILKRRRKSPLSKAELMASASLGKKHRINFERALTRLQRSGDILERDGRYRLASKADLIPAEIGRVHGGFGFARLEDGTELFIPGRYLMGAMPGDKVLLHRQEGEGDLDEGRVQAITRQNDALLSGTVHLDAKGAFLLPDSGMRHPVPLSGGEMEMKAGDKVVARLIHRGERHSEHRAGIVHNFGDAETADNAAAALLMAAGIDRKFTDSMLAEADRLNQSGISNAEMAGREDLRDLVIFTIDGADTKDIDDAISIDKTDTGYRLGVHIADVSHYVRYGSDFDKEAYERGTSVYYVDKVIPMLPPGLSNGICSLNPNADRLAFSVFIDIDQDGKMTGYRFFKSLIRSRLQGVYSEVNALLSEQAAPAVQAKYSGVKDALFLMAELADLLNKRRKQRGALELESTESKFMMDAEGRVADILPATRGQGEELIESFMLMANQAAAAFAEERELPFIFRVHDSPPPQKIIDLHALLNSLGLPATEVEPGVSPAALSRVLAAAKETSYGRMVDGAVLRSMAKAIYSEQNRGHFGLVMKQYSHFTSPIRRYPDLYIHRIMSEVVEAGRPIDKVRVRYAERVRPVAAHCSATEQRAVAAERGCVDIYKAEYMRQFIGQEMEGVIVSVTFSGLYVALPNTVEGMIRAERLPGGGFEYDGRMAFTRPDGRSYRVGDSLRVVVSHVSVSAGQVDFDIAHS